MVCGQALQGSRAPHPQAHTLVFLARCLHIRHPLNHTPHQSCSGTRETAEHFRAGAELPMSSSVEAPLTGVRDLASAGRSDLRGAGRAILVTQ